MSKQPLRPVVESLDARALPSASGLTALLQNGQLVIDGTNGNDRIVLNVVSRKSVGAFIQVQGIGRFPLSQVQSISVLGDGGNDYIDVNVRKPGL